MAKKKKTKGKVILSKAIAPKKARGTQGKKSKNKKLVVGRWGGHKFIISPSKIESFRNLTIKGSCEIETKKKKGQKYTTKKTGNAVQITMDIVLNAFVGSKVKTEALKWVREARKGKQSYFYMGKPKKKVIASKLVLKSANVKDIELSPKAEWVSAVVSIDLEQSTKKNSGSGGNSSSGGGSSGGSGGGGGGGGGSNGGGGGGKQSIKSTSPITTTKQGNSTLTDQQAKYMQGSGSTLTDQQRKYINGGNNRVSWLTDQQKKNIKEASQKKKADENTLRKARQKGLP